MKKLLYIISFSLILSCENTTKNYLDSLNTPPVINFFADNNTALTDSIKMSLKNNQESYDIVLSVYDENKNIKDVIFSQTTGRGELFQNGKKILNILNLDSLGENIEFKYFPLNLGYHNFTLTVRDNFNASSSVGIELVAFDNLAPVAQLKISREGRTDTYQYIINAEESYDRDKKFGGGISRYEFDVLDKLIYTTNLNSVNIIFPEANIYRIGLRVQDNDGVWSEKIVLPDYEVN